MIAQTFLDLVYHVDRRANRQTHRFSPSWVRESIAASLIGNVCYKPAQAHSEPKNGLTLDLRTAASPRRGRSAAGLRSNSAKESGISAAVISHFETGTRQRASAANLVKLAEALSISVDYLLGRTDQTELRDDRVHATFRRLSDASADTIDRAVRVVEALLDREGPKKK